MSDSTISRTKIPFIADLVTIRTAEAINKALATGELVRFSEVTTPSELPLLYRWYFPVSRFLSPPHGLFMPFRASTDPTYDPVRNFLDDAFKESSSPPMTEHVKKAAELLETENPSDEELSATFARAMTCRFLSSGLPDKVLDDANKQIEFGESFLPWKYLPAKGAMRRLFSFFESVLQASGVLSKLPNPVVTDVGQSVLATTQHGGSILKEIGKDPNEDIDRLLARLALVETVHRMVKRETTLGGMLESVAKPGWTVVRLDIRGAATATGDVAWAFGTGTTERRCAAEPAIKEFFKDVQTELKSKRSAE